MKLYIVVVFIRQEDSHSNVDEGNMARQCKTNQPDHVSYGLNLTDVRHRTQIIFLCWYTSVCYIHIILKVIFSLSNLSGIPLAARHQICRSHWVQAPTSWCEKGQGAWRETLRMIPEEKLPGYVVTGTWIICFHLCPYIGNFTIPTDELHHFSEG